jgi:hypothetical protein
MSKKMSPRLEIGFSVFLITLSVVVFWEALSLPPGSFDPLGSAGFPRLISMVIGILSLIVFVRAVRGFSAYSKKPADPPTQKSAASPTYRRRPDLALGFYALALIYVLVLAFRLVSFAICTALFLVTIMAILTRFERKWLPAVILIALLIGFGCQYIFTQVFVIDLP